MKTELIEFLNNADCKMPKNILVIGVIHGDESVGEYLIKKYLKNKKMFLKNNLYYIPRLNSNDKRKNKNGVDLNRNFPTKNWSLIDKNDDYYGGEFPACEKETEFLINLAQKVAFDAIITIHTPYKIINYDGIKNKNTLPLARKISNFLNYPLQEDIGYPTPGSMGTYFGIEKNIPIITIECDENEDKDKLYLKFEKLFKYLECEY